MGHPFFEILVIITIIILFVVIIITIIIVLLLLLLLLLIIIRTQDARESIHEKPSTIHGKQSEISHSDAHEGMRGKPSIVFVFFVHAQRNAHGIQD